MDNPVFALVMIGVASLLVLGMVYGSDRTSTFCSWILTGLFLLFWGSVASAADAPPLLTPDQPKIAIMLGLLNVIVWLLIYIVVRSLAISKSGRGLGLILCGAGWLLTLALFA